ncbi:MAG TPA: septum formation protein Maf [Chlorobaculum sp.]|uniref:dTTP/UTP pyrophosphatase n=1 Tax=Chlorobaculum tepidum (strain ATCC 49652 / DSM 12025 / NBRC 103806 / TLS) TaxID=194439 RepID=NTPPA_CHLTE|nr:nucleoside triphosphate pyrophosphatase [Chlorobaculum tepidum]Q8KDS1.1 RecName: Full=dTTP/UTP pyrophosphatase; Short=dTTPase/UTPase; AltName: Full=Nucleoside triphosphate pyrophosphatase; AltName: Full=Nucleotide pyrophosphatase; Short=Nucleotide PPase [Chlorobaculum tepidum TLS]AAM72209.1 maf protein [Chlorobaculum tepidum TLS]HBU23062.1 septum formation protein Maf [Chlorobaculum sp.]
MTSHRKLILASQSPRRRELLAMTGIPFETASVEIDETFDPVLTAEENVMEISKQKAEAVLRSISADEACAVVLGSDTTVVLDGKPLGKPGDFDHAFDMLSTLQGRSHEVLTGFCILHNGKAITDYARTIVEIGPMTPREITRYIEVMKPFDKAGSYGIQDPLLACFVTGIDGCYYNVVGLPVSKVYAALKPLFPAEG